MLVRPLDQLHHELPVVLAQSRQPRADLRRLIVRLPGAFRQQLAHAHPQALADFSSVSSEGSVAPRSKREIVSVSTPTRSASAACVQRRPLRNAAMRPPRRWAIEESWRDVSAISVVFVDNRNGWVSRPGLIGSILSHVNRSC